MKKVWFDPYKAERDRAFHEKIKHLRWWRKNQMDVVHSKETLIARVSASNRTRRSHIKVSLPTLSFLQKESDK